MAGRSAAYTEGYRNYDAVDPDNRAYLIRRQRFTQGRVQWRRGAAVGVDYAPSSGAVQMAEAIVNDQKRILPCAAWLQGEYGMKDLFLGVPCKIGRGGLERVLEVELTADERAALAKSAEAVRELMRAVKL